jgi:hypothetical protein
MTTYTVVLRYIGGNLSELMHAMRVWFDDNRIEPADFFHSCGPPGLAFRVGFRNLDDAEAFAEALEGCVQTVDLQGAGGRWIPPPSLPVARRGCTSTANPARSQR